MKKQQILYLDHLMVPGVLDAAATPRCAYYTSEIIRSFIHAEERKLGTVPTRYGKCKVIDSSMLRHATYKLYLTAHHVPTDRPYDVTIIQTNLHYNTLCNAFTLAYNHVAHMRYVVLLFVQWYIN
jgi:hypothetical protein